MRLLNATGPQHLLLGPYKQALPNIKNKEDLSRASGMY